MFTLTSDGIFLAIQTIVQGLIALSSLLVVIIVFLLDVFIDTHSVSKQKAYFRLIWFITFALFAGIIDIFLSLPILLGICDEICIQNLSVYFVVVLLVFSLCLFLICIGTYKIVRITLGGLTWSQRERKKT